METETESQRLARQEIERADRKKLRKTKNNRQKNTYCCTYTECPRWHGFCNSYYP